MMYTSAQPDGQIARRFFLQRTEWQARIDIGGRREIHRRGVRSVHRDLASAAPVKLVVGREIKGTTSELYARKQSSYWRGVIPVLSARTQANSLRWRMMCRDYSAQMTAHIGPSLRRNTMKNVSNRRSIKRCGHIPWVLSLPLRLSAGALWLPSASWASTLAARPAATEAGGVSSALLASRRRSWALSVRSSYEVR
jgi:hypothetical protein